MYYRGRIAPSPTGYLHLGHARTFWIAYQRTLAAEGELLLRIDDLDAQRSKPIYTQAVLEDLRWLGITWRGDPIFESAHVALYQSAFEHLRRSGHIYACQCSRKDLQNIAAPHAADEDDEPMYSGTCRSAGHTNGAWRFRVPDGEAIRFVDAHFGEQTFLAGKDFGDFLVMRRDGIPSYQLACAVDDEAMRITEVVRGRDLLKSTARQILLQRALGYATPQYFHCDLMTDEQGVRLAKRHDALSLRALREQGVTPAQVIARF
ncbi:MAG: tRNA glutamyl-Q(34) synthetase GluQRS [Acidobacteria bacterium]|nr:tRNA glutamyl-Q(34) synthetase GluQRS [Acidobacteriota bacterium]